MWSGQLLMPIYISTQPGIQELNDLCDFSGGVPIIPPLMSFHGINILLWQLKKKNFVP